MFTDVKWSGALIMIFAALTACSQHAFKAPENGQDGYIQLASIPFCAAFGSDDSTMKKYKLEPASERAHYIVQEMEDYSGISMDIDIFKGMVPNALATTYNNKKIIVYNENFIEMLDKVSGSSFWQSIYILAHEIGHHLYAHVLAADTTIRYKQELQADQFAGFILYRMGAPEEMATWIMNTAYLQADHNQNTHPARPLRAAAISRGWQRGYQQAFNIPVPPPPPFDEEERNSFLSKKYFDCADLLSDSAIYRYHTDLMNGCQLDSITTAGAGMIGYFMTDSIIGPEIFRDTLVGVILNLENPVYNLDLGGFLESTDARIRILKYNKQKNPLFNNDNLYVTDVFSPDKPEGGWNYFTKTFKPGQWLKFKVIVENASVITNTYRFSYLEFIAPPNDIPSQNLFSPLTKTLPNE